MYADLLININTMKKTMAMAGNMLNTRLNAHVFPHLLLMYSF